MTRFITIVSLDSTREPKLLRSLPADFIRDDIWETQHALCWYEKEDCYVFYLKLPNLVKNKGFPNLVHHISDVKLLIEDFPNLVSDMGMNSDDIKPTVEDFIKRSDAVILGMNSFFLGRSGLLENYLDQFLFAKSGESLKQRLFFLRWDELNDIDRASLRNALTTIFKGKNLARYPEKILEDSETWIKDVLTWIEYPQLQSFELRNGEYTVSIIGIRDSGKSQLLSQLIRFGMLQRSQWSSRDLIPIDVLNTPGYIEVVERLCGERDRSDRLPPNFYKLKFDKKMKDINVFDLDGHWCLDFSHWLNDQDHFAVMTKNTFFTMLTVLQRSNMCLIVLSYSDLSKRLEPQELEEQRQQQEKQRLLLQELCRYPYPAEAKIIFAIVNWHGLDSEDWIRMLCSNDAMYKKLKERKLTILEFPDLDPAGHGPGFINFWDVFRKDIREHYRRTN